MRQRPVLRGVLTDGDIRRAILQGKPMNDPCDTIATRKPMVATRSITSGEALDLMNQHDINHLPVVDAESRVVGFLLRRDLVADEHMDLSGCDHGRRIWEAPAPVDGKCAETHAAGRRPSLVGTDHSAASSLGDPRCKPHHALSSRIHSEPFWRWRRIRREVELFERRSPHGHRGWLRQMKRPDGPFLVINGDILTEVPFQEMLMYHRKHAASSP